MEIKTIKFKHRTKIAKKVERLLSDLVLTPWGSEKEEDMARTFSKVSNILSRYTVLKVSRMVMNYIVVMGIEKKEMSPYFSVIIDSISFLGLNSHNDGKQSRSFRRF